jgi:hypothetical protein
MYLIAKPEGFKKSQLFKVKQNGATYIGTFADHTRWSGETITIKAKEVVLHLGDNPALGTCYDTWVEPINKRINVKGYGEVFFYSNPSEKTEERICKSFTSALKFVRSLGPQCDWEMITEVRNPKDKKAGLYHYKSKGVDRLISYDIEGQSFKEKMYVVTHELGHGVWFRYLTSEERTSWIELYDRFVEVKVISPQQIKNILKDIRQLGAIKDFAKNAEPEESAALAIFMGWLKKVHNMSRWSFQDLILSNGKIPIPDTHLHRSEMTQVPVTNYSKTSAEEMFCEALGSYAIDTLDNKQMIKMLENLK